MYLLNAYYILNGVSKYNFIFIIFLVSGSLVEAFKPISGNPNFVVCAIWQSFIKIRAIEANTN